LTEEKKNMGKDGVKRVADNRAARHEYFVLESTEAGIELFGTEVKSIRAGGVNLKDAWIGIDGGEAFVNNMHVSPYEKGNIFNRDPLRRRKLLLHKREILKLFGQVRQGGLTLVPLSMYFKGDRVKVQVGLCKGKKLHDKRDAIAERDTARMLDRAMKERGRVGD
jgi:SsrA-binding protein